MELIRRTGIVLFGLYSLFISCFNIDVDLIKQYPEFPAGCECASTVMLLNHLGYDISLETFVDKYLKQTELSNLYEGVFDDYFVGNPRSDDGWMCYVKPIENAVTDYFCDINETTRRCYDLTGTDFDLLRNELISGNPVVIWVTMEYDITKEYKRSWGNFHAHSHTVLMTGFDLFKDVVYINDPIKGKIELPYQQVKEVYELRGMRCLVIK